MKTHKEEHASKDNHSKNNNHNPKINNSLLAIIAIFAIFFILWITIKDTNRMSSVAPTENLAGQALQVAVADSAEQNNAICKIIVGQTTIYDTTTLAVSLDAGQSTYYTGYAVTVTQINNNGCTIDINGNTDYIAVGQVQRIGPLYVTVKEVLQ
jgi:hypothetical protein